MFIDAAGLIFYAIGVGYYVKFNSSIKATVLFVGIGPVIFNAIYRGIMAGIYNKPFGSIFTLNDIVTACLQLLCAFVIFWLARRNEENIPMMWFVLTVGGFLSYAVLPGLVDYVVAFF